MIAASTAAAQGLAAAGGLPPTACPIAGGRLGLLDATVLAKQQLLLLLMVVVVVLLVALPFRLRAMQAQGTAAAAHWRQLLQLLQLQQRLLGSVAAAAAPTTTCASDATDAA